MSLNLSSQGRSALKAWVDSHLFSPTELEVYQLSPPRYFFQYVLGLRIPEPITPDLSPREQGELIHRILERYFRDNGRLFEQAVATPAVEAACLAALGTEANRWFREWETKRPGLNPRLFARRRNRILAVLEETIRLELAQTRARRGRLVPTYLEWGFGGSGETPPLIFEAPEGPIRIRGRIDRIDVDPRHKRFLVIDYKTGATKVSGAQILKGEHLQLPLYLLAAQRLLLPDYDPLGGVFFHLSDLTKQDGLVKASAVPDYLEVSARSSSLVPERKWDEALATVEARVRELVKRIRAGDFAPRTARCEPYCDWRDICRCRERREETEHDATDPAATTGR